MIHCFQSHGYQIVVDVYSGSVHLMDDLAYRLVQALDQAGIKSPGDFQAVSPEKIKALFPLEKEEELTQTLEEIQSLVRDEALFTEDCYGDLSCSLAKKESFVKALCLNVAHSCNLDCNYCFASQGKYHGERALMSFDVAKNAIDFVCENSGSHKNIDIDFFGGEPLLNWELVKKTVAYAEEQGEKTNKNFRFTLTTNGLLLDDEVMAYLNQHMHNVVLSLDGRREVHDYFRHDLSGEGSYDRIVPKFQKFVKSRGDQEYYLRGTFTRRNKDFYEDILHMAGLGFHRLSMEPVIGDPSEKYMFKEEDLPYLKNQYDLLTDEMLRRDRLADQWVKDGKPLSQMPDRDRPFVFYHFMINMEEGPCIYKRISGCGSGTEYMAVTPQGDLFPCHQFVGEEAYLLGNVFEGIKNPGLIREFQSCNCYSRKDCQSCWAKLFCSGGCAANALHAEGAIQKIVPFSCELFRKRMECALTLKVDEMVREG